MFIFFIEIMILFISFLDFVRCSLVFVSGVFLFADGLPRVPSIRYIINKVILNNQTK